MKVFLQVLLLNLIIPKQYRVWIYVLENISWNVGELREVIMKVLQEVIL
jgi:hypothetical protein